jgi:hypothetical protein
MRHRTLFNLIAHGGSKADLAQSPANLPQTPRRNKIETGSRAPVPAKIPHS